LVVGFVGFVVVVVVVAVAAGFLLVVCDAPPPLVAVPFDVVAVVLDFLAVVFCAALPVLFVVDTLVAALPDFVVLAVVDFFGAVGLLEVRSCDGRCATPLVAVVAALLVLGGVADAARFGLLDCCSALSFVDVFEVVRLAAFGDFGDPGADSDDEDDDEDDEDEDEDDDDEDDDDEDEDDDDDDEDEGAVVGDLLREALDLRLAGDSCVMTTVPSGSTVSYTTT
jgi:hypothetical protein